MAKKILQRILYAEDEVDIRSIAQIALEDIGGFTVKYCGTGQEVLDEVQSFQPDLLLLDVMMPGMDGPTALLELRKRSAFKNIPAIFMTAKVQASEIEEYKVLGVAGVIEKPFDPMTLAERIQKYWDLANG
jgi:two-component system OmpR family response regulator